MKKVLFSLLLLSVYFLSSAQKEANIWYFGNSAGLDFNSGAPVALSGSAIYTNEGCASIADRTTGQLLFYTDGSTIWNMNHTMMPGGSGLGGNSSSSQCGVIVPVPGDPDKYYVFSVDAEAGFGGIQYAMVDMLLNGGLGSVITANNQLITPACEKLCATHHSNGVDVWVTVHQWNTDAFYSYLVTSSGISAPVISNVGNVQYSPPGCTWCGGTNTIGYLKFSPDGSMIAMATDYDIHAMQVFDFDNSTGVVGSVIFTDNVWPAGGFGNLGPYGCTFSPDNKLLYVTVEGNYDIYQYDMTAGSAAAIVASRTVVGTSASMPFALQIAPDGLIYVALYTTGYVGRINNPNIYGSGCGYQDNAVNLGGGGWGAGTCLLGLPDFIESYFAQNVVCTMTTTVCDSILTFDFLDSLVEAPATVLWNFGDPNSGLANVDTNRITTHAFTSPGNYTIQITVFSPSDTFTIDSLITIPDGSVIVDAGLDQVMCVTSQAQIDATITTGTTITWSPSAGLSCTTCEDPIATPVFTTTYTVIAESIYGCSDTDQVTVTVLNQVTAVAGNDTIVCLGESVNLFASGGQTYSWFPANLFSNPTSQNQTFTPNATVTVGVEVSAPGGCIPDTAYVNIQTQALPVVDAGVDVSILGGTSTQLIATGTGTNYSWTPSAGLDNPYIYNPTATPLLTTTYFVTTSDALGCSASDSVTVNVQPYYIGVPSAFTPNGDGKNDMFFPLVTGNVNITEFQVFNRWGEMVHNDPLNAWDGRYKGLDQEIGSFVYVVIMYAPDAVSMSPSVKTVLKGNVTLVR